MKHKSVLPVFGLWLSLTACIIAQPQIGGKLRHLSQQVTKKSTINFHHSYALRTVGNQPYIATLAQVNQFYIAKDLQNMGVIVGGRAGNVVSLQIPLQRLNEVLNYGGLVYVDIARKAAPLLKSAVEDLNADSVHSGYYLRTPYTGKNVIIGITDWGFDYTHPTFYDTSLTQYRVLGAWDQFRNAGPAPQGFTYGTELSTKESLLAAGSDTSNIYFYNSHGTHVGGISGGSGATTPYRGIAYDANFLFASWLIDEASVLDAYVWMKNKAIEERKRLVINGSWGIYHFGSADGTSLFDQALDALSTEDNVIFVTSAGNNASTNFHIAMSGNNDTLRSEIEFRGGQPTYWGETITMIGDSDQDYSAAIEIYDRQWNLLTQSPWVSPMGTFQTFTYDNGTDSVIVEFRPEGFNRTQTRRLHEIGVRMTHQDNHPFHIVLTTHVPSGTVHAWNVAELTTGVGNWGLSFLSSRPGFIAGDDHYGIGEPAIANEAIAVAAHLGQPHESTVPGTIAYFSSFGPGFGNVQKPFISAPGVSIISAVSSFDGKNYYLGRTRLNEKNYYYANMSGTSMSSPMITGCVALMLEANPWLNAAQIREIISTTARQDESTGVTPNNRWGYGKMNAFAAVKKAEELAVALPKISGNANVVVYPNPTSDKVSISIPNEEIQGITLYDMTGRIIKQYPAHTNEISLQGMEKGMYLLHISGTKNNSTARIVKR